MSFVYAQSFLAASMVALAFVMPGPVVIGSAVFCTLMALSSILMETRR